MMYWAGRSRSPRQPVSQLRRLIGIAHARQHRRRRLSFPGEFGAQHGDDVGFDLDEVAPARVRMGPGMLAHEHGVAVPAPVAAAEIGIDDIGDTGDAGAAERGLRNCFGYVHARRARFLMRGIGLMPFRACIPRADGGRLV